MAQQSRVPKFGNWEADQDVPYTQYFDKARKNKLSGSPINPNDPQEYKGIDPDNANPIQAPPFRNGGEPEVRVGAKPRHERRLSKEDGDLRQQTDSPARHDAPGRRTNPEHRRTISSGDTPKKAGRQGGGNDRSIDHSPLHPHYQARVGGRGSGVSSPSSDRRASEGSSDRRASEGSHGVGSHTPGRSRLRSAPRGDETPDKSAAVPKFGEWDENNPASADGFTHIFNKMREEKQSGSANVMPMPDSVHSNGPRKYDGETKCCCFAWGKK